MSAAARRVLTRRELARPAPELAPGLIGCELTAFGVRARICETEAYQGEEDLACHAARGCTPRSEVLYRAPGTVYLYLCYGIHVLLNIVCDRERHPAAVLIRGVEVLAGERLARERRDQPHVALPRLANGPGKVSQALGLELGHNRSMVNARGPPLRLQRGEPASELRSGPRVGVAYAGAEWAAKPWRWWAAGFPAVDG